MDKEAIEKNIRQLIDLKDVANEKQFVFYQNMMVASVSIFGILIALHDTTKGDRNTEAVFLLSLVFLLFGILLTGITVHDYAKLPVRIHQAFHTELGIAINLQVPMRMVSVPKRKKNFILRKSEFDIANAFICYLINLHVFNYLCPDLIYRFYSNSPI